MKCDEFLKLAFGMVMLTATTLAGEFNVHLKVLDSNDKPVPEFEVITYSHDQGFAPWKKGKDSEILLKSRDYDFPAFGDIMHCQIITRAAGFAPAIIEMDRPEGDIERTVRLTKGQSIEMVLTEKNGRAISDSLIPLVVFPDFQDTAWHSFQHKGKYEFDYNFTSLVKVKAGHYTFNIADDSPEIYVFIDHPGFMRAFRAGPFSRKELADGRLKVELPKPATLEVVFEPPKDWVGDLPYTKCNLKVMRKHPDEKRLFPVVSIKSEIPRLYMPPEFFAPGNYWIELNTGPSDDSEASVEGKANPAFYRDMKEFSLTAGQAEKVVFQYTPYDENSYKGDYSINVNIRWHNGKPAMGVPYTLYYEDKHFGSIIIEEAEVPDDGQIKLAGLAGGDDAPHFTLEIEKGKIGRYLFQLLGEEKKRELEYKIAPLEGNMAPDITVVDIFTGEEVKLSDYRGKVIFVEFWATWCGPCQSPTAKLCQMASKRKNDWADKAALLCISIDEKKEHVINHVRNRGWLAVRHLWCHKGEPGWKSDAAQKYRIAGVPTALLIDQSGNIVWRGHPESVDIEAKIDELLR
jgi:thiol-disulfide isomerase/thioredoxin